MVSHIVIIVQNGILPAARVAGVPSAYVIPALTTDIRRFVVYLHVILGQPFLQMLIACGNLTPGRRYFNFIKCPKDSREFLRVLEEENYGVTHGWAMCMR